MTVIESIRNGSKRISARFGRADNEQDMEAAVIIAAPVVCERDLTAKDYKPFPRLFCGAVSAKRAAEYTLITGYTMCVMLVFHFLAMMIREASLDIYLNSLFTVVMLTVLFGIGGLIGVGKAKIKCLFPVILSFGAYTSLCLLWLIVLSWSAFTHGSDVLEPSLGYKLLHSYVLVIVRLIHASASFYSLLAFTVHIVKRRKEMAAAAAINPAEVSFANPNSESHEVDLAEP